MVFVDEEEFRSLPATIAAARAYHSQAVGDVSSTVQYAKQVLDLLPGGDHLRRWQAATLLGLAYWTSGDLEAAYQILADTMADVQMTGNILLAISATYGLADITIAQGRLRKAVRIYKRSLQLALSCTNIADVVQPEQGESILQGTADLYLGLGALHHEQDNQEAARQHLLRSEELGQQAALPDWPYRLRLVQAQ